MLRVLGMSDLTPTQKNVLAALASFDGPGGAYPSLDTLAAMLKMNRYQVSDHLSAIKSKGRVVWRKGQRRNNYTIFYDNPAVGKTPTAENTKTGKNPNPAVGKSPVSAVGGSPTLTGIKQEYKQEGGASIETPMYESNGSALQETEKPHPVTNKNDFFKCLDRVSGMTAGKPVTNDGKQGLWEALQDQPLDLVKRALNNHVQDNKFFPTLAEIKNQLLSEQHVEREVRRADWKNVILRHNGNYQDRFEADSHLSEYCGLLEKLGLEEATAEILDMAFTVNHDRNGFWPSPERLKCIILNEPEPPRSTTNH